MPYNHFDKFKKACKRDRKNVILWRGALNDAEEFFNLRTETQLIEFIAHDGLEDLSHQNTKPWEKNPNPQNIIMVYAYTFRTMCQNGYIAIMENELTKKWIIKSFKPSTNKSLALSSNTMQIAFEKAILEKKG